MLTNRLYWSDIMISIITVPELWIVENGKMWTYTLQQTGNKTLVYVPPPEKNYNQKYQQDEIMFFPISPKEFKNHRVERIAYRFLFISTEQTRIDMPGNINISASTNIYLTVSRVAYRTRGKCSIIIDHVYDSLFPPFGLITESNVAEMSSIIETYVHNVLDNYCPYYLAADI